MHEALRPYATAGVALVGASMIAVAPVATSLPEIYRAADIQLTAGGLSDILSIPVNTIQDAFTNIGDLAHAFGDANTALVDAIHTNPDWFSALTNPQEIFGALTFLAGDQKDFLNPLATFTLGPSAGSLGAPDFSLGGGGLYGILTNQGSDLAPGLFPELPAPIPDIAQVLASPLSGVLLGAVSPLVAPIVPFLNPFMELIVDLQNGTSPDIGQLFTQLLTAPLNSINGLLNGDTLNLDALVPLIAGSGLLPLPEGDSITALSFAFGGLLSPGVVGVDLPDENLGSDAIFGGGSILNALGLTLQASIVLDPSLPPIVLDLPSVGQGVGPFGALIGLEQVIASLFSGDLDFGSGSAAALDLGSLFPDLSQFFSGDLFADFGQLFDISDLLNLL